MENRKRYSSSVYIDGNTVRRIEEVPETRNREEERRRREIKRRNQRTARRNQERALQMSRGYVAFLSVAALVTACISAAYIQLQSDVTGRQKNIAALESQIANLKADNDATTKRIDTMVNLDAVKDAAINQLGMVYAKADQIIYYSVDNDDYMNQYGEIPKN